jgi:DNA mismatch endonuclease, patch repair protein
VVDHVDAKRRSAIMRAVRTKHTGPERLVRKAAHRMGLRFRLNVSDLPGRPDLVFPKWRIALFVNGCFWHRHSNCKYSTTPKSNRKFWTAKFLRNVERDADNVASLRRLGWTVVTMWQCEVRTIDAATFKLRRHFSQRRAKRPAIRRKSTQPKSQAWTV